MNISNINFTENASVIKYDESIQFLALNKKVGIKSHPNKNNFADSEALLHYPYDLENECYLLPIQKLYLLNRLDSPTSGVIWLTFNLKLAEIIQRSFKNRKVQKYYIAIVKGKLSGQPEQLWEDTLTINKDESNVRAIANSSRGLSAATNVKLLKFSEKYGFSLIQLMPKTGRTHQLRVQSANRNKFILGDKTYGDFSWNKKTLEKINENRMFLHCVQMRLKFEFNGKLHEIKTTAKCDFNKWF